MPPVEGLLPAESPIPDAIGPIADMAGVLAGDVPVWLVLGTDGVLSRWDPDRAAVETLASIPVVEATGQVRPDKIRRHLHASRCGRFAAVVDDYGSGGAVIDLATGRATMTLNGGDYYAYVVPFALAFAEHEGAPVLIHRTAWNRLDVSDPATGRLLTERESPERGGPDDDETPHYIDYFHGALYLSPDGTQVYDAGWIWQPFGIPMVWSVSAWLRENVWESEDGPSRVHYAFLDEWDRGVVWIAPNRIAVEDVGDHNLEPACVRILDPTESEASPEVTSMVMKTVTTFPGSGGRYFTDGTLLLVSGEAGLQAWDIDNGLMRFDIPGFRPLRQHPHSLELVEIGDGAIRHWTPK